MTDVFHRMRPARYRPGWSGVPVQVLLALLVVLVTVVAVVSYTRMVRDAAERQMQNTADLAEVFLNQQNAGIAEVVETVTEASEVSAALQAPGTDRAKKVIENILTVLAAANPDASTVVMTDARGRILADVPGIVPVGYDVSARPWYLGAVANPGFTVSPVFRSQVTGQYLTTISVPVRVNGDPQGQLLGVIAVGQKLEGYQRFVDSYAKARGVRLTVIDGAGAVVADGGKGFAPEGATVDQRLAAGVRATAPAGDQIAAVSSPPSAARVGDWRVVGHEATDTALRPAMLFRAGAIVSAGLLLLAIGVFSLVRRRFFRARRVAARHLEQSQARMRDLADSSPDMLFRLAPGGSVIFVSRSSETLFGRSPDDMLGNDLFSMLEMETAPDGQARMARLLADGEPQLFVARTAGDEPRILEGSLRLGTAGDAVEIWGALRDITDRRTAVDQVEQLFQLSEDFMAVIDFDGRLVQVNPVWTAAFGIDGQKVRGTDFGLMFQSADRTRVAGELARLVTEPVVTTFENRYERDGVVRTLLWTMAPDPVRKLIYAVGRDISEHKELARALVETRDEALEASRLKSEFVATMSHEIRTPMNGVIGLTDLLLDTRLDATQRRYVEGVRTAGDALLSVINDILDFSKIEAGRLLLDSVDFRLEDVVDDVVTLVRQTSSVKGLELTVDYEAGVPFALNGDPGRVRQILLNLAHNAVKFTEEGSISVRVAPGPMRSDGQISVIFKISDTGIGIDPARMEELFEPFRQADEGATRAYGGTGLGLSICRRLAGLMGGSITATSELGKGATFTAELVFVAAADWGRAVRGRDARGLAVLVVDDNEVNRLVMITQLSRWGMRPVAAASAAEALLMLTEKAAPAGGYDLAVVDMHMPDTDGLGLVRQLRALEPFATLPVILLSSDESVHPEVALEYRISAWLTKPVQQSDLFDALTRVGVPSSGADGRPAGPAPAPTVTTVEFGNGQPSVQDGGFRLLLVEDNDINQTVALGILSQLGYEVDVAGDGLQALTMAGQHAYDAILMDCQMPKMDGYTATVELRKRSATRATPIIAMTAATFAADRQRCFDSGMDDFIAKPVRAATLQATLNRWLRSDQAAESTARPPGQISGPPPGRPGDRPGLPGHVSAVRDHVVAARESLDGVPEPRLEPWPGGKDVSVKPIIPEQPAPAGPAPVPDMAGTEERIAELLGDGSELEIELVREIIASFLARTVDLLQRLTLAVAADDAEAAYLHAHSLAGAGLNLGTVEVVRISREIEADAKAGRPALSVARLVDLEVALDQARVLLRDLAAGLPDAEDEQGADQDGVRYS